MKKILNETQRGTVQFLADRANEKGWYERETQLRSVLASVDEAEKRLAELEPPDWLTKEDREKLLRLSYSLDYIQYATSADFIRSLLARLTPPEVRE
jgi:hypothetical protein